MSPSNPPFGPRLIGQTEKALNALLQRELDGFLLREPEWVALQLAAGWDGTGTLADLARGQSHLADADAIVDGLAARGLVAPTGLTPAGAELRGQVGAAISARVGDLWESIDPDEAATAARVLERVRVRCQELLAG